MGRVPISLITVASDIASVIETAITVNRVSVTADEPPASDDCSSVSVWGIRIYDSGQTFSARGDDPTCLTRRTYELGYRVEVCRTVRDDGKELTPDQYLADATDFDDKIDATWCALAHAKTAGTLVVDCEDVLIGELVVDGAQGDRISATGTIKVTQPCAPEGS